MLMQPDLEVIAAAQSILKETATEAEFRRRLYFTSMIDEPA
jgi:hypothetical protein